MEILALILGYIVMAAGGLGLTILAVWWAFDVTSQRMKWWAEIVKWKQDQLRENKAKLAG